MARNSCLSLETSFQPSSCTSCTRVYTCDQASLRRNLLHSIVGISSWSRCQAYLYVVDIEGGRLVVLSPHHSIEQNSKYGSPLTGNASCESFVCAIVFQSNGPSPRRFTSLSTDTFPGPLAPEMLRTIFAACLGQTSQI